MTVTETASAAQHGAAFLDEHLTDDWRALIKTDNLDIGNCKTCVLGQLYGYWADGMRILDLTCDQALRLGFDAEDDADFSMLNRAWREIL